MTEDSPFDKYINDIEGYFCKIEEKVWYPLNLLGINLVADTSFDEGKNLICQRRKKKWHRHLACGRPFLRTSYPRGKPRGCDSTSKLTCLSFHLRWSGGMKCKLIFDMQAIEYVCHTVWARNANIYWIVVFRRARIVVAATTTTACQPDTCHLSWYPPPLPLSKKTISLLAFGCRLNVRPRPIRSLANFIQLLLFATDFSIKFILMCGEMQNR